MGTRKVIPEDLRHGGDLWPSSDLMRTTKQVAEAHMLASPPVAPAHKARMVSAGNLGAVMTTRGASIMDATQSAAFGSPLRGGDSTILGTELSHFQTTNQHFYVEQPAMAKASPPAGRPDYFAPPKPKERPAVPEHAVPEKTIAGPTNARSGARGEMSRHPGEAGSVYGVSVWADEYGKWGTKLQGQTRAQAQAHIHQRLF